MAKINPTFTDTFRGMGCSLMITAPSESIALQYAHSLCGFNSLPYGGLEAGIQTIVGKNLTPDNRPGVVVGIFYMEHGGRQSKLLRKFSKKLSKHIKIILFPKLSIRIFNFGEKSEKFYDSFSNLGEYGAGFEKIVNVFGREMTSIPMPGGTFLIDQKIFYHEANMGLTLLLSCRSLDDAVSLEPEIDNLLLTFPNAANIYGLAASGSKKIRDPNDPGKFILVTNTDICQNVPNSFLREYPNNGSQASCVVELVINGFMQDALCECMNLILPTLTSNERIVQIRLVRYFPGEKIQFRIENIDKSSAGN